MTLNEVSPPGWGHTKAEKEKTKPNKPKSKIGGSAAAFKRALDDGRFKGLPGDKTKKEKTASMFKLMWSMKKKGAKPHYKPGTDEKKKKYQEEGIKHFDNLTKAIKGSDVTKDKEVRLLQMAGKVRGIKTNEEVSRRRKPSAIKKRKQLDSVMNKYDDLKKKIGSKEKHMEPAVEEMTYQEMIDAGWEMTGEGIWWPPQPETVTEKISFPTFKKKVKERKPEKAMDAGAKARRKLKRKEHAKYVSGSEDNVPDDIRDHYEVSEGKKKGLWDNIHAKRKRGEKPAKPGDKNYPKTLDVEEGAAWTRKAGKNKEGGLNEKGRKSYERDNPGSDLKAPQPEGGSRKKSFCARMGGMKKKLTSKKTANDPDSRINKALRKWKC